MKQISPKSLSVIALTGGLVSAAGGAAHAAYILSSTATTIVPAGGTLQFNLATGAVGTTVANPQFTINYDAGQNGKSHLQVFSNAAGTGTAVFINNASSNDVVSLTAGSQFSGATTGGVFSTGTPYLSFNQDPTTQFRSGVQGYAGLQIPDPSGAARSDYGYAQVTVNSDGSVTLSGLAYENSGGAVAITPISVPEPGTMATSLLAVSGAVGAVVARRRRAAKTVAA